MKKLLGLALLFGGAGIAGDLGPADLNVDSAADQRTFHKRIHCGNPIGVQPKCTVEFKGGLLVVDGEHSIKPNQVRHFSLSDIGSYAKKFEIVYLSNAGKITRAQISLVYERDVNRFYRVFLDWLNEEPATAVTSTSEK